jgi:hypothetical protein
LLDELAAKRGAGILADEFIRPVITVAIELWGAPPIQEAAQAALYGGSALREHREAARMWLEGRPDRRKALHESMHGLTAAFPALQNVFRGFGCMEDDKWW